MKLINTKDIERLHFEAANYKQSGQLERAEKAYLKLIVLERSIFGGETSSIALSLYNLAQVLIAQHKIEYGREALRRAVEIWEKSHPCDYLSLLSYTEAVAKMHQNDNQVVHLRPRCSNEAA